MLLVGIAAIVFASAFVVARWHDAANGDLSRFVVAGSTFTDPGAAPSSLAVRPGPGYDGQFFWRLAADPTYLGTSRHLGMVIDSPLRIGRIGYPIAAYVFSFGNVTLLPEALILVNIVALGVLAMLGASIALDAHHSPWYGLALATVPAFAFSISRDLSEILACALLIAGVLAIRRERWLVAATVWSFAVLTREQALLVVASYLLYRVVQLLRRGERVDRRDAAWLVPFAAFAAWQGTVWAVEGHLPVLSSTRLNFAVPIRGLSEAVPYWIHVFPWVNAVTTVAEVLFLGTLVTLAFLHGRRHRYGWELLAVAVLCTLAVCLTRLVWDGPADLRTLADLSVLAWAVLLSTARRAVLAVLGVVQAIVLVPAGWLLVTGI